MAWYDTDSWATAAFSPKPATIALTLIVAIVLPLLVHAWLYRSVAAAGNKGGLPRVLVVGPSGAGKTGFVCLAERNVTAPTHTSTIPLTVEALLPEDFAPASSHFRSRGDPSYERSRRYLLVDTPGHGKLRRFASAELDTAAQIRGIVFLVDAAALAEDAGLNDAAEYLHDVLLALQKKHTSARTSKGPTDIPLLIAANKLDLFTALPPHLVKLQLEKALSQVRRSRAKGLKDSADALAGDVDGAGIEEDQDWLGDGGAGQFDFAQMQEVGTTVEVRGGNVTGGQAADVSKWFEWIAEQL